MSEPEIRYCGSPIFYSDIKRGVDVTLSILAIVALSPLIAGVAVAVAFVHGRPILFRQRRPGLNGQIFELLKFRTMTQDIDAEGRPLPDEMRMTRLGAFLRYTSLDELPELWNVVRGDMSLVGPRPLLPEYLQLYSEEQFRRHEVRPGITGWAQIHGRNRVDWEARFKMDVWYVDNFSMTLDVKILIRTVIKVIRREGISEEGHVTMGRFRGNGR